MKFLNLLFLWLLLITNANAQYLELTERQQGKLEALQFVYEKWGRCFDYNPYRSEVIRELINSPTCKKTKFFERGDTWISIGYPPEIRERSKELTPCAVVLYGSCDNPTFLDRALNIDSFEFTTEN